MKQDNSRKKRAEVRNINIGIVVLLLVFLYMVINIIISLKKDHLSIYEVQAISMSQDGNAEAVIVRTESDYYTQTAGYTNFFIRSGSRVAVGDTIYSIDESRNVYDYLVDYGVNYTLTTEDVEILKEYVSDFNDRYADDNFEQAYLLRDNLNSEVANISDSYLLDNLDDIVNESGNPVTFNVIKADKSGTISFFNDSLDGLTADEVSTDTFDKSDYTSQNLYDNNLKESDSMIYKIVSDENWSLVINLSEKQYEALKDKKSLSFKIKNDGLSLTKSCSFYQKGEGYFCRIDLTEYMIRYLKERFLDIEITMDSDDGLKIPYSSITTKEFYKIPSQYYIYNEETEEWGFTTMEYDIETKQTSYKFLKASSYFNDKENGVVYVDTDSLEFGQYIYSMNDETLFQVSVIGTLKGVYNVNKGYAVFKRINIISENDDYCIILDGADNSLKVHDHIALHADLIIEDAQIY